VAATIYAPAVRAKFEPVCEILRGSISGQFVVPGQELPTAYVHAKFEDRSFTRLQNIEGVPKFRNSGTYPGPRPISGQFVVRGQEQPTAYAHAKFEGRSFFRLRNIEGVPKFRNWVTYPRPRPLRGQFVVRGQERPMCVPNLKGVALSVCEILAHFAAVH